MGGKRCLIFLLSFSLIGCVSQLGPEKQTQTPIIKPCYPLAAKQFLRWNHAGGRVMKGLTERRRREMALFNKGC
jgi:GH24 family phage-related lysozyme (muramidase)